MPRFIRHDVHPLNPQTRLLQYFAAQIRAGAVVAVPSAAGYALACRLDDKSATGRLRRCADPDERSPAALLCRDLAQAAGHLHIDDHAYRVLRASADGTQAFALRANRHVPRRLAAAAGGIVLLHFGGHAALQALLDLLDEPLLMALPPIAAQAIDELPASWLGVIDAAVDAGALPDAGLPEVVDLDGLLQARPSLSRWLAQAAPALAY
jgi:tRNA A37 threonylcarbamoyladenosine synthetase subunit TsaC/SUA5/YrdC